MTGGTVSVGTYSALGHTFRLWSTDLDVARHLATLYRALPSAEEPPETGYGIEVRRRGSPAPFVVHAGARRSGAQRTLGRALSLLAAAVNRAVVAREHDQPLLHAAAAARAGRCVLLPAGTQSGKSTVVTGLLVAGWAYLSDEAVLIDAASRSVVGLAKPISLDPGSWALFPELRPTGEAPVLRSVAEHQWQVAPESIGVVAPCTRAEVAAVVFPRYDGTTGTEISRLRRTEALERLLHCAFRTGASPESFRQLADVARHLPAYRLTTGGVGAAVDVLTAVLEDSVGVGS